MLIQDVYMKVSGKFSELAFKISKFIKKSNKTLVKLPNLRMTIYYK